ncbi:MAG: hypothetical protein SPL08_03035 [Pseudomonadota bacterium]|nr:hypothetical protein [Pseudomonadota bacterium]
MFKSIKSKIVSFMVVVAALTQSAKAEEPHQTSVPQVQTAEALAPNNPQPPKESRQFPWGGVVGVTVAGVLAGVGAIRTTSYSRDDRYFSKIIRDAAPVAKPRQAEQPVVSINKASINKTPIASVATHPQSTQASSITHRVNMTPVEREILANQLMSIRVLEEIKRKRAQLTRQMAKAKKENNVEKIQEIQSLRRALSAVRKEAFERAMGPVSAQVKKERRMLTKKMALAKRQKDAALQAEIAHRRIALKQAEVMAKQSVRNFNYRQERPKFIRKKKNYPLVLVPNNQNVLAA